MGLLNVLQAASNTAADTVAAPVDGIAWILRKMGVPVEAPVGGSDWMRRQGLTREVAPGMERAAGETLGLLSPMVAAAKAPQIASGLLKMGENAAAPGMARMGERGAIVWHGSPHKFDKFDSSKIGTGEGAQAYGHGLYLAESPDVAKKYSDIRAGEYLGGSLDKGDKVTRYAQNSLLDNFNDPKKAAAHARAFARSAVTDEARDAWVKAAGLLDSLPVADSGSLYKVDLPDEAIAKMLDWDKPLSQQAPGVADALRGLTTDSTTRKMLADDTRASAAYKLLGLDLSSADEAYQGSREVANALRQRGIPGIRYLDGSSRGAGAGTSNFVVFPGEEGLLRILERNGQGL